MPAAGGVLYQPSGPTSFPGTYSPAGSVEGSPMHTVYMTQPAAAAASPYSSVPGAGAGNGGADKLTSQHEPQTTPFLFRFYFGLFYRTAKRTNSAEIPRTLIFYHICSTRTHKHTEVCSL